MAFPWEGDCQELQQPCAGSAPFPGDVGLWLAGALHHKGWLVKHWCQRVLETHQTF